MKPTLGSSVKVWGTLIASPKPMQPVELQVSRFEMLGINDVHNYPLQRKAKESPEFLREILHLRARTPQISAAMRVRDCLSFSIASFMRKKGVLHVHTPVLTSNDCEGAGELFSVSPSTSARTKGDFFGKPVHLTVSGQLHLEALAVGGALSRVYSLGPTFRAEDSNTPRHLCEFWMLEAELAPGSMHDSINLAEPSLDATTHISAAQLPLISSSSTTTTKKKLKSLEPFLLPVPVLGIPMNKNAKLAGSSLMKPLYFMQFLLFTECVFQIKLTLISISNTES